MALRKYTEKQRTDARAFRTQGLSTPMIADRTGVNKATIAYWFNGDDERSGAKTKRKVARKRGKEKGGAQKDRERKAIEAPTKTPAPPKVEGSTRQDLRTTLAALDVMDGNEPMALLVWSYLQSYPWSDA